MNWRGKALRFCQVTGLPVLEPFVRLAAGENKLEQLKSITKFIFLPCLAIIVFIALWDVASQKVVTDSARLPSPRATLDAGKQLIAMHYEQRATDAAKKLKKKQEALTFLVKAKLLANRAGSASGSERRGLLESAIEMTKHAQRTASYQSSSAPTFVDQIFTSVKTVFFGFVLATLIAVPVGVLCGINPWINAALTPFIQIFKPVSPLAWLPLAFIIVVWLYSGHSNGTPMFQKAFLISAATVSLCSLWPTLVNTTLGVASVDKDYLNVAKVLKLSWSQKLFKIILPASLPLMFAGLRISLGVGWMVLIAADMLAQNPGLGKFVWDEFQNGSSQTYARIAFSVLVIGLIGLVLDRMMICCRNLVSFGNPSPA